MQVDFLEPSFRFYRRILEAWLEDHVGVNVFLQQQPLAAVERRALRHIMLMRWH
jgi:hypothetical protein